MRSLSFFWRNSVGDLTLPFFGFILVGGLTIASLTGLSQYNIVSSKINKSIEEAQVAAQNYVQDNIPDSAMNRNY